MKLFSYSIGWEDGSPHYSEGYTCGNSFLEVARGLSTYYRSGEILSLVEVGEPCDGEDQIIEEIHHHS